MKLTLAIPVMNQLEDTKGQWGLHLSNITNKPNVELLVIDNGSTDGTRNFIESFIFPNFPDHKYVYNEQNIGVVKSMNQCINESKGDVIAILHNDVYVFERGWDEKVLEMFENDSRIGLSGFLGAAGLHNNGGRINTMSNMLEAEIHGLRVTKPTPVSHFDGFSLIGRREMFTKVGGFDENYSPHHFYDRDISAASHYAGYINMLIPVFCHHRSGITANRAEYQTQADQMMGTNGFQGDLATYKRSEQYFLNKWKGKLPIMIGV